ncbi:DgyrCDS11047 [Dimorphilus gyrociliatus]|uniref:DgyrCDS11047 n=1 Tax=Dimorphilus gyrociliatus TaxID=2664684 RepID=A0A7I8W267_9ANNE|nr:DgyrCDS11047 [Dimorphilus gyrociliatus]
MEKKNTSYMEIANSRQSKLVKPKSRLPAPKTALHRLKDNGDSKSNTKNAFIPETEIKMIDDASSMTACSKETLSENTSVDSIKEPSKAKNNGSKSRIKSISKLFSFGKSAKNSVSSNSNSAKAPIPLKCNTKLKSPTSLSKVHAKSSRDEKRLPLNKEKETTVEKNVAKDNSQRETFQSKLKPLKTTISKPAIIRPKELSLKKSADDNVFVAETHNLKNSSKTEVKKPLPPLAQAEDLTLNSDDLMDDYDDVGEISTYTNGSSAVIDNHASSISTRRTGRTFSFPPPMAESPHNSIELDASIYNHVVSDVTGLKTLLLKLKRCLNESEDLEGYLDRERRIHELEKENELLKKQLRNQHCISSASTQTESTFSHSSLNSNMTRSSPMQDCNCKALRL